MVRPNRVAPVLWAVLAEFAFLLAAPAHAQQYKTIAPRVNAKAASALAPKVSSILRTATALNAEDQKTLDDYFKSYLYSEMTSTDPVALGNLAETRQKLFRQYLSNAKSQPARDYLVGITMQAMKAIAKGGYHPAVRYNAALIISQLDQTDASGAPKPLAASTEELIAMLEADDAAIPTPVKFAALVGLVRQTGLGVDDKYVEPIAKATLAIATRPETPEGVSRTAYDWMRRLAIETLAHVNSKAITKPLYDAAVKLVSNKKIKLDERCGIAASMTAAMYDGLQGLDRAPMALAIGALAKDVFAEESKKAQDYLDEELGNPSIGMGGGGGFGGEMGRGGFGGEMGRGGFGGEMGGGFNPGMPGEEGPKFEKRRMLAQVLDVRTAADALGAGAQDEVKQRMTDLATPLQELANLTTGKDSTQADVAQDVVDVGRKIRTMVGEWTPEEEQEADDGGDAFAAEAAAAPRDKAAPKPAPAAADNGDAAEKAVPPAPAAGNEPAAADAAAPAEAPAEEAPAAEAPADAAAAPAPAEESSAEPPAG